MAEGIVLKNISEFFYIKSESNIYEAKARGNFAKHRFSILPGDLVDFTITDQENLKGIIEKVHKRKSFLKRPAIANITKTILIFSLKEPQVNFLLLDRFIALAQLENLKIVLGFTKSDLDKDNDFDKIKAMYEKTNYSIIKLSAKDKIGIDQLKSELKDNFTVIAGPSGAGKSSLINCLSSNFNQETGEISQKLQKGKNTTTYASLLEIFPNTFVADTPGFTSLSLNEIEPLYLKELFVEFEPYSNCKFGYDCTHIHEPGCKVKEAVAEGLINKQRYDNYCTLLEEIQKNYKRW